MTVTATPSSPRFLSKVTLARNTPHERKIHRVAMAPLTRYRNDPATQAPTDLGVEYYTQRASQDGLLITEATFMSEEAGGYARAPGIYSDAQVEAWKKVTDGVHSKGGLIFCQFWALGRANGGKQEHIKVVAPSAIGLKGNPEPEAMTEADIDRYIANYKIAAENALRAGFDGVELHGANGYLVDQFLQSVSNKRTDSYGGSVENRARFAIRALEQITSVFGQERTGIRLSAWGRFQDMLEDDPYATFLPYCKLLNTKFPKLGYVHLTESRDWTGVPNTRFPKEGIEESNDAFRAVFRGIDISKYSSPSEYARSNPTTPDASDEWPTVILSAAGHNKDNVRDFVQRTGDVAVFGRFFIANPDLPKRLFEELPVREYDRSTFYTEGAHGYTDLPTWEEEKKNKEQEKTAAQL